MKRLLENYVTTLIGLVILVFSGVLLYHEKINTETFAALLALALTYLRAKDSLIGLKTE